MRATACRMDSLPVEFYRPQPLNRALWRAVWRECRRDAGFLARPRAVQRKVILVLIALHECRDFRTNLTDVTLPLLADEARMGVTCLREALVVLWELGWLEIIPRRQWDPKARPPGWRGVGKWGQYSNAYEPKLKDTPRRWPQYGPEEEREIEIAVVEPPPMPLEPPVENLPELHSELGIRAPSRAVTNTYPTDPPRPEAPPVDNSAYLAENRAAVVYRQLAEERHKRNVRQMTTGRRDG